MKKQYDSNEFAQLEASLRGLPRLVAPTYFKNQLRTSLLQTPLPKTRTSWFSLSSLPSLRFAGVGMAVLLLLGATGNLAAASLPSEVLYPVKQAGEGVEILLSGNAQATRELHLTRRLHELTQAATRQRNLDAAQTAYLQTLTQIEQGGAPSAGLRDAHLIRLRALASSLPSPASKGLNKAIAAHERHLPSPVPTPMPTRTPEASTKPAAVPSEPTASPRATASPQAPVSPRATPRTTPQATTTPALAPVPASTPEVNAPKPSGVTGTDGLNLTPKAVEPKPGAKARASSHSANCSNAATPMVRRPQSALEATCSRAASDILK